jgi:outer membrane lipoprotein-sorting protein
MKKILLSLTAMTFSLCLSAQTAEEIVENYLDKIGGKENLQKLESIKKEGIANTNGMEFPITILAKGKDHFKSFINFQGMEIVQPASYDGNEVWNTNPMTMQNERMPEEASEAVKKEALDFPDPLLAYDENGYKLELGEEADLDGEACFIVTLVKPDQVIQGMEVSGRTDFFISKDSGLVLKKSQNSGMGPIEMVLGDYQEVNGILFPFLMETKMGGNTISSVTFKSIETNIPIDDILFRFPE